MKGTTRKEKEIQLNKKLGINTTKDQIRAARMAAADPIDWGLVGGVFALFGLLMLVVGTVVWLLGDRV